MKEGAEVLVVGADAKVREVSRRQVGGATVGWGAWEGLAAEGDVMDLAFGQQCKGQEAGSGSVRGDRRHQGERSWG